MARLLCVLLLSLVLSPQAAAWRQPASWTTPTEPFEIFDDTWWVGSEGLAAYLFVTADGLILLDVGLPGNAGLVRASIEGLGHDIEDVRILINSHAHFDHSGGLAAMKSASGARLLASEGDRFALENGIYPGFEGQVGLAFPPVGVDRVITDGESVTLGGVSLTAHLTPGHSPGCTSWSFRARHGDERYRALVFCSASVALNRLVPEPQYQGIVADYRATFEKMKSLKVDAYLTPHPEQFDMASKRSRLGQPGSHPFVDPGEKDRRMAAFERAFEETLEKQQSDALRSSATSHVPFLPTDSLSRFKPSRIGTIAR